MAKRRPRFEALEQRLCLTGGPVLQTTITLPNGSWTPSLYRASPLFVDIHGTGQTDLIAVAAGAQLVAYVENSDGTARPDIVYQVPHLVAGNLSDIAATPIVVTDPSTGRKDLFDALGLAGTGDTSGEDGLVFGWDLLTGKLLPGAWSTGVSTGTQPDGQTGVYGALTSGYLQGNGIPDIVVTSWSHEVTAITLQGSILWQWNNNDTMLCGAVVADIDRDGSPDVIVGGDSSANPSIHFQDGGWVTVLNSNGQVKWRKQLPGEVTWSTPVVADLLNNGQLDVIIGTGANFASTLGAAAGEYLYALDPSGNELPGWPYFTAATDTSVDHEVLAAPIAADLTGSGQLDVVAIDRAGYLHVVGPNGKDLPGFAGGVRIDPQQSQMYTGDDYASPIIADVNGSGRPEIIASAGGYINAFTATGQLIPVGTTPNTSRNVNGVILPEGVDSAPAVGNFDGTGGLCLAVATYDELDSAAPNHPDKVQIYQLPVSTLTPPWPSLRRTVAGDAVARSPIYDQAYVTQAFNVLLGGQPSAGTFQLYLNALNTDATNLLSTAQLIAISPPVVQAQVSKVYQAYLGRPADSGGLAYWSTYLQSHPLRQMEIAFASGAEFATHAGGTPSGEVTLLYQAILGRTPSPGEVAYWVGTGQSAPAIASAFLGSAEAIKGEFNTIIQAMFGPGTQGLIPPDELAAYSLDSHAGLSEAELASQVLASAANYAATNFVASYIQDLYHDVLGRVGSASDLAFWLTSLDNGSVSVANLAADFAGSVEAKQDDIQFQFLSLLGHTADPTTLANLTPLSREAILSFIVGSQEFFNRNGGTNSSFVAAAFLDLGGITIDQGTIAAIDMQLANGQTRAGVATGIIYTVPSLYFQNLVVNQLEQYIPDEAQGVLRSGVSSNTQVSINPDPNLVNYFVGLYQAGLSDEQVLGIILTSPQYYSEVSSNRGFYRSLGIRY